MPRPKPRFEPVNEPCSENGKWIIYDSKTSRAVHWQYSDYPARFYTRADARKAIKTILENTDATYPTIPR